MTSRMVTMDDTFTAPSLMASAAMWEWESMMPGVTYLPVPSTTWAPPDACRWVPTAAIFPFRMRMSASVRVPWDAVITVAPRMRVTSSER